MTDRFIGPITKGSVPAQPTWTASWPADWNAFDVPRMWSMVEHEGRDAAWEQVKGFRFLADFLDEQYRVWRSQRDRIAGAWQSPAGTGFLRILDTYGSDLLSDAACARQTSHAWNRTVQALDDARKQMGPVNKQWSEITSEYMPWSWDDRADELNRKARQIMIETDSAVAAARPYIARPVLTHLQIEKEKVIDEENDSSVGASFLFGAATGGARPLVPPMPGYEPVAGIKTAPQLATATLPQLPQGAPRFLEAVPGTPVSMLPIPPGNIYSPFGGAYILPGPGVGRGGYVVPMPQPRGVGPRTLQPPIATGSAGTAGMAAGMMPMPMAGGQSGSAGQGALYRRPNIAWQVGKGVPPVIKVDQDEFVLGQPTVKQEEEFRDWFTDLAYPWRAEFKSSEGAQVTIRTVPE